ncbi:MAG: glutamate--tRNA ligase family protein [Phycisphaerales bacterium]|jgi:glutamyl-tRNA synthetase|nr:glutamate--tRNA ligase family protein [Phycisphaerales bacterium]
MPHMTAFRSRLAPSPTGALHLGNARTFAINWALARQQNWSLVLRIEDLDHPRVKPETIDQSRRDLAWLGLNWDEEMPIQSSDTAACRETLRRLGQQGLIFPCNRTRKEVAAAQSAPHGTRGDIRYEPSLRPPDAGRTWMDPDPALTWRFLVDGTECLVQDELMGEHRFDLAATVGDFPVWTAKGPAYQLAVAVDDARQGITDVVRGNDLLPSGARQQVIYAAIDSTPPRWWHVPLIRGEDGLRLAKRHGDTRVSSFAEAGVPSDRIMGLMALWCGIGDSDMPRPMDASEFATTFDITRLASEDITLTREHLAWLIDC